MSVIEIVDSYNVKNAKVYGAFESFRRAKFPMSVDVDSLNTDLTAGIENLAKSAPGAGHDNFLNGIVVQFDLTFTVKAWTEAERYHFFDFVSSQSTMHRIAKFTGDKYIHYVDERIKVIMDEKIREYNAMAPDDLGRAKKYLEILYSNPCGMFLTAGMTTNYRQLKTIYNQRRTHRLPEWRDFCKWIEGLPYAHLITGENLKTD